MKCIWKVLSLAYGKHLKMTAVTIISLVPDVKYVGEKNEEQEIF